MKAETRIADALASAGWYVYSRADRHRYDLVVAYKKQLIDEGRFEFVEVKNEDEYCNSDNFLVETFQGISRKPSGFATSDSTVGINTFMDWCAVWRVREMMRHIASTGEEPELFGGKTDNRNGGYKMPKRGELERFPWYQWTEIASLHKSRVWRI